MASNRTVFHVDASGEDWLVIQECGRFHQVFRTKEEAEYVAKEKARTQEPSQVKVHNADGNMEYEFTYGEEPRRFASQTAR